MTPELLSAMQAHAAEEFPRESCGVVIDVQGVAKYWPCVNAAAGLGAMVAAPLSLIAAEDAGRVVGYAHSHAQAPPRPSLMDVVQCDLSGLPWWVVQTPGTLWERMNPTGRKLTERLFLFGVDDCWAIVREWYALEMKIELADFVRDYAFWEDGFEPHVHHMKDAGFSEVSKDDVRRGDVMLFRIGAKTITHCGVFLGDGKMLHHIERQLSRCEILDGKWAGRVAMVVRFA